MTTNRESQNDFLKIFSAPARLDQKDQVKKDSKVSKPQVPKKNAAKKITFASKPVSKGSTRKSIIATPKNESVVVITVLKIEDLSPNTIARATGFEPAISSVTGRRHKPG